MVSYFPPDRLGGVGEVAAHVHRALLERGHESWVLTTGTSHDDPRILRVATTPDRFVFRAPIHWKRASACDVVHIHHGEAVGLLAAFRIFAGLARLDRPRVLLTLHASAREIRKALRPMAIQGKVFESDIGLFRRTMGMRVRHALDRAAMAMADRVTFISRSSARDFLGVGSEAEATVIYNGLPDADEGTIGAEPVDGPEPVDLLFVGVHNLRKRIPLLPFVLERVRREIPAARLRLIGFRSEDHPALQRLARELGVETGMVFEGPMRSDELPPFYRAARVLLVPSIYEGLPMVVMEAFQHGLPCVATRVSGHPEIVESGVNGFLVEPDNPDAMADAALKILLDAELARSMSRAARRRIRERFGVERQVESYLDVYRELAADRGEGAQEESQVGRG